MIHVYGENTTIEQLREIPLVTPDDAGGRWKGVKHGDLIDSILGQIETRGWGARRMQFALGRGNADLCGAIELDIPSAEIDRVPGVDLAVGFMTSNARMKALRLFVGGEVRVCHNGLTTGEIVCNKKHSLWMDLDAEIEAGFDRYLSGARQMGDKIEELRDINFTPTKATGLIEAAGVGAPGCRLMPPSRLWDVSREYFAPTHPEHGLHTGWALLNAFTMVAKQNPAIDQLRQIDKFREMVETAGRDQ